MVENKNIRKITKELLMSTYKTASIVCIIISIVIMIYGTLLISRSQTTFHFLFIGIAPMFIFISFVYIQAKEKFFKDYAKKINFVYQKNGDPKTCTGSLFRLGHRRKMNHLLIGQISNHNTNIFNYAYTIGHGKHQHTYQFQVFEIDFNKPLPFFVLKEKEFLFGTSIDIKTNNAKPITLEGDFNNFFNLEVEKEFEIELLQIFTPDLMHELCEKWKHLSIESVENRLYVYENRSINETKELDSMCELATHFIKSIENLGPSFFKDVETLRDIIGAKL